MRLLALALVSACRTDPGGLDPSSCGAALCAEGDFTAVSSGGGSSVCALDSAGAVRCWERADLPAPCVPPAFSGAAISIVNLGVVCALLESGLVECADLLTGDVTSGSLDGPFTAFDLSGDLVCGVDGERLECNWDATCGPTQPVPVEPVSVVVRADVAASGCVMEASGTVYCWGYYPMIGCQVDQETTCDCDPAAVPVSLGPFEQLAPNLCGLTPDGAVECPLSVYPAPIPGVFEQIAGRFRTVAISSDGALAYSSFDEHNTDALFTPNVAFQAADTGSDMTCGIDLDGSLWCWGDRAWNLVACE